MSGQEVQGMLIRLEATTAQLRQEMARADATVAQVSGRIDRQLMTVDSAFTRAGQSASSAGNMVRNAMASALGGMSISSLIRQADAYATIASRLRLVTSSAVEFNAAQKAVFSIAQSSYQPLTATAELYQRIATNQRELALTGEGVAGIVGTISKTMAISGASASSANAALIQLGQAFASGVLRGEELNSVMEQAPALAQAIAAGMGKTVGELRTLGAEGKLTADAVVKALQSQQKAVEDLYAKTSVTIGNSITAMGNSYTQLIGRLDQAGNASARVAGVIVDMSKKIDMFTKDSAAVEETLTRVTRVAETLAVIIGARLAVATGQMIVGFAAATAAAIKQAGATAMSVAATNTQLKADAAAAIQAVASAQAKQADAKAAMVRAEADVLAAEQKVASDRIRQQSEIGNLRSVQASLVAERQLEGQRLKAQISDIGRQQSIARMVELRQAEIATANLVRQSEAALAQTTVATSATVQAAYEKRAAAVAATGETTLAVNAAVAASERATAAATTASRSMAAVSAAGGALLRLMTGPIGLIAMTGAVAYSFMSLGDNSGELKKRLGDLTDPTEQLTDRFEKLNRATQAVTLRELRDSIAETQAQIAQMSAGMADKFENDMRNMGAAGGEGLMSGLVTMPADTEAALTLVRKASKDQAAGIVVDWKAVADQLRTMPGVTEQMARALEESQGAVTDLGAELQKQQKTLSLLTGETDKNTAAQANNNAAQALGGQTKAQLAEWDKYVTKLTETRDLIGANAEAETALALAKMGATDLQKAQGKVIAQQTDVLKKYETAVKENNKVEQAVLKTQLVALYTKQQAAEDAAVAEAKAHDDAAKAAKESADKQINELRRVIAAANQTWNDAANISANSSFLTGKNMLLASQPKQDITGRGMVLPGVETPKAGVVPRKTALQLAEERMQQVVDGTTPNKEKKSDGEKLIEKQAKALEEFTKKADIAVKSSSAMADAYLKGADNVRALTIQQEIEEELLKAGAGARDKVTAAINAQHDAQDRLDVAKTIADMKVEVQNLEKEAKATLQGTAALEAFNVEKAIKAELAGKNIAVGSEEYKQLLAMTKAQLEANKALEAANKANDIVDRLNPQIKLLKDYTEEQKALNSAMALYPENAALYRDALVKLGNEYEVNRSKATLWGQMTEAAIDRIDSVFANAWANIGDGAESLWDNLKKGFKQTLGEIAHMLTTKPLLASFSNWLTGTDNGQGFGAVWSKLIGSAGGSSSGNSGGGLFSGLSGVGQNLLSAWNAITGVGASVTSGFASGGITGAVQGGVGYYSNMLSGITSTLSNGFSSLVGTFTGATAANAAAIVGAEGITAGVLSGAITQGAASVGAQFGTGVTTMTAASYAAAEAGAAATAASLGGQISAALSSAAAMWPLAIIMGMYQSGKLYSAGVRPDADAMWDSGGGTAFGKGAMLPATLTAKYFEKMDGMLGKVVGGKMAAILTGSTLFQAVWGKVGSKLFGSGYETKDSGIALGVDAGVFDAQSFIKQKKKGGLISGSSKTRFINGELAPEIKDPLGAQFNDVVLNAGALFSALGVELGENVLDGMNVAWRNISTTDGSTPEWIQEQLDFFFAQVGDSAVQSISAATDAGLSGFSYAGLQTFVKNLQDVNGVLTHLNVGLFESSVQGGYMAEQLALWAGGIEALNTAGTAYYSAFFTDTEQANDALSDVRKAFGALNIALPDSRDGFRDMVSGIDKTTESGRQMLLTVLNMSTAADAAYKIIEARQATYYSGFYSEAENAARSLAAVTQEFKDVSVTLPETRAGYRELVEAASKDSSAAGKAMYDTLMSLNADAASAYDILESRANSAAEATRALADTLTAKLESNVTAAMSAVERAISAEQKTLTAAYNAQVASFNDMVQTSQQSVSDLTSISNSLASAMKSLNGSSADAAKMLRSQAQATLQSALATARAGGSLASISGLDEALAVVSGNTTDLYASMDDFNREQGRTANIVAELNVVNGKQLTSAEQTVKALQAQIEQAKVAFDTQMSQFEQQLELAQTQIDALNGVDNSVLSVAQAINAMNAAVVAALGARPSGAAAANTVGNNSTLLESVYQSVLGRDVDAAGASYWGGLLQGGSLDYADLVAAITKDAKANGEIPAFARGGLHAGGMRLVGENGPELEVTGPSRIYSAGQTAAMINGGSGDNAEIVAELRELRREVSEQRQYLYQTTVNTGRTDAHLDVVRTNGVKIME
ncbi:tape measure protein [Pseudomonas sp. CDFA 602]|uniref:tape measure protein n=1 Tax=Pseudomonas californiensis TaxID=2829823 RepID=UPI001E42D735|nr:tape measure protein [Pseudomonas californiensis]MCD5996511.1 tape measure protein [Pseudomonas californiensis]MCD6002110.1 tape measure protein [Pseudomonas californiensis]